MAFAEGKKKKEGGGRRRKDMVLDWRASPIEGKSENCVLSLALLQGEKKGEKRGGRKERGGGGESTRTFMPFRYGI